MPRAYIGIGSNQGDRLENISKAIQRLSRLSGTAVTQVAPIVESAPLGPPQPDYLNTVVELETSQSPGELLASLKQLERGLGRVPSNERWGPRPIDLDILLYDDRVIQSPDLVIPHAEMHRRWFVLAPLAQLASGIRHPVLKKSIAELLAELPVEEESA